MTKEELADKIWASFGDHQKEHFALINFQIELINFLFPEVQQLTPLARNWVYREIDIRSSDLHAR